MKKLKQILVQIFCTKIGWLMLTLFLAVVFGVLAENFDCEWCAVAMYVCFLYPVGLTLVMIAYGWVINPIRDRKKSKKMAEQYKKDNDGK